VGTRQTLFKRPEQQFNQPAKHSAPITSYAAGSLCLIVNLSAKLQYFADLFYRSRSLISPLRNQIECHHRCHP